MPAVWGTHRLVPSGENSGPSGDTEVSVPFPTALDRSMWVTICFVCRLKTVSAPV